MKNNDFFLFKFIFLFFIILLITCSIYNLKKGNNDSYLIDMDKYSTKKLNDTEKKIFNNYLTLASKKFTWSYLILKHPELLMLRLRDIVYVDASSARSKAVKPDFFPDYYVFIGGYVNDTDRLMYVSTMDINKKIRDSSIYFINSGSDETRKEYLSKEKALTLFCDQTGIVDISRLEIKAVLTPILENNFYMPTKDDTWLWKIEINDKVRSQIKNSNFSCYDSFLMYPFISSDNLANTNLKNVTGNNFFNYKSGHPGIKKIYGVKYKNKSKTINKLFSKYIDPISEFDNCSIVPIE